MDDTFKEVPNFGDSLAEAEQGSSDRGTGEGPIRAQPGLRKERDGQPEKWSAAGEPAGGG